MPSNVEFLQALFGEDAPFVHVTDFHWDPNDIPKDQHLIAWSGDWFSRYQMRQNTNQYFTISIFNPDEKGVARRRKALYLRTRVIVLDDVKEKLAMSEVSKLPPPSWILETSPGSEQWGYILTEPCHDRHRVENLLDGLVANGLAPDGRDPGMKGVTRYVRLPEGVNNKASKLVNGQPFRCRVTLWEPFNTTTLEALAAPFSVDLDATRREARTDGASDVPNHPILQIPDVVKVKEIRSAGRFDIVCPWVDEHTGADDSGAAIFTNDDGSIGFKCHHGACQHRTAGNLLRLIESRHPGFSRQFIDWQVSRSFADVSAVSFMQDSAPSVPVTPVNTTPAAVVPDFTEPATMSLSDYLTELQRQPHNSAEARELAQKLLRSIDSLPQIERKTWHDDICDHMRWSKTDFKDIIKDLRSMWYQDKTQSADFYDHIVYIKEQNQFFDFRSRIFFTAEAFQNSFAHEDDEARKTALVEGRVTKVDKLNYSPLRPRVYEEGYLKYGNAWDESTLRYGTPGDVSRWLDHFDTLGWEEHRDHVLQWMAYTVRHPDQKINHILLLGSREGCGKDFLLYPLISALGNNANVIDGNELLSDFNDYLLNTKYLHVNETDLGDHRDSVTISNKIKPLASSPPDMLRVNPKGIRPIRIDNIVNVSMTTNSLLPLRFKGPSRRIYALWSDLKTRDQYDRTLPEWEAYWRDRWEWMKKGGVEACIYYLRNCVDLSTFQPSSPPPMTQFLRDIRQASKPTVQVTLERFIREKVSVFNCDLLSIDDICTAMKASSLLEPDLPNTNTTWVTPMKLDMMLHDVSAVSKIILKDKYDKIELWALRDVDKYTAMTSEQVYDEWQRQLAEFRKTGGLKVVKG